MADDRLYPKRPILAASIAVVRGGRVLIASRTKPPARDLFTLPGGLVEAGETLEAAALRELAEEVGVGAEVVGFNRHVEIIERDGESRVARHFVIASFVGRWIAGEPRPGPEAGAVMWAAPGDLAGLSTTARLDEVIAAALAIHAAAGR